MADTKPKIDGPDLREQPEKVPLYPASSESLVDPATFDSAHPEYFHRPSSEHEYRDMREEERKREDGEITEPSEQQQASLQARDEAIERRPERISDEDKKAHEALKRDLEKGTKS